MKYFLTLILAAACSFAHAGICPANEIQITVLPFNVVEDFSKPIEAIQEGAMPDGLQVGLVKTAATVKVTGCSAVVGYANPVLYVAREMNRNSCAKEHVLEHEREHVRIYEAALADLEARIRSTAETKSLFDAAVQEVLAVAAANAAHDNPAEYRRNVTACGGKVMKLAMHSM